MATVRKRKLPSGLIRWRASYTDGAGVRRTNSFHEDGQLIGRIRYARERSPDAPACPPIACKEIQMIPQRSFLVVAMMLTIAGAAQAQECPPCAAADACIKQYNRDINNLRADTQKRVRHMQMAFAI
jgi:hypothetical protein